MELLHFDYVAAGTMIVIGVALYIAVIYKTLQREGHI